MPGVGAKLFQLNPSSAIHVSLIIPSLKLQQRIEIYGGVDQQAVKSWLNGAELRGMMDVVFDTIVRPDPCHDPQKDHASCEYAGVGALRTFIPCPRGSASLQLYVTAA